MSLDPVPTSNHPDSHANCSMRRFVRNNGESVMNAPWNPAWRLAWCVVSAVGTVVFVAIDWMLREWAGLTGLAPTAVHLWVSVGAGMALGLVAMLWESYLLRNKREFLLSFHRTGFSERLQWKHQRKNLQLNGWLVLAILFLIACCYFNEIFVLPAILATNAVLFMGNRRATQEFQAELRKASGLIEGA